MGILHNTTKPLGVLQYFQTITCTWKTSALSYFTWLVAQNELGCPKTKRSLNNVRRDVYLNIEKCM